MSIFLKKKSRDVKCAIRELSLYWQNSNGNDEWEESVNKRRQVFQGLAPSKGMWFSYRKE